MPRYALTVAYDGSRYSGFAIQKNRPTVQKEIESALRKIYGKEVRIKYASRTDAGVHSLGQVIAFDADGGPDTERMPASLNALLPSDIRVVAASKVPSHFNPSKDANLKLYRYIVYDGKFLLPHLRGFCLHIRNRLDVEAMNSVCRLLCGRHNFAPLVVKRDQKEKKEVSLDLARVFRCDSFALEKRLKDSSLGDFVIFELEAQRFLYKMVRSVCGLLVEVGERKLTVADVLAIIRGEKKWRIKVLPPQGLYLVRIEYGDALCSMQ
ncbi:MAG: tRNA pseudouridine(38-40) synthase TruA [Planctomycetota bacterium]|nr:tRNA pseudouridine(38-40) synthase TruA [Planctomycetota bacterium]